MRLPRCLPRSFGIALIVLLFLSDGAWGWECVGFKDAATISLHHGRYDAYNGAGQAGSLLHCSHFHKFEIVKPLGAGTTKIVYLARHSGITVAWRKSLEPSDEEVFHKLHRYHPIPFKVHPVDFTFNREARFFRNASNCHPSLAQWFGRCKDKDRGVVMDAVEPFLESFRVATKIIEKLPRSQAWCWPIKFLLDMLSALEHRASLGSFSPRCDLFTKMGEIGVVLREGDLALIISDVGNLLTRPNSPYGQSSFMEPCCLNAPDYEIKSQCERCDLIVKLFQWRVAACGEDDFVGHYVLDKLKTYQVRDRFETFFPNLERIEKNVSRTVQYKECQEMCARSTDFHHHRLALAFFSLTFFQDLVDMVEPFQSRIAHEVREAIMPPQDYCEDYSAGIVRRRVERIYKDNHGPECAKEGREGFLERLLKVRSKPHHDES